jgi:hypothetical protein
MLFGAFLRRELPPFGCRATSFAES